MIQDRDPERKTMLRRWASKAMRRVAAAGAALALPTIAHAAAPPPSCGALAKLVLPGAQITAAEFVGAGRYSLPTGGMARLTSQPGMDVSGQPRLAPNPAFCKVDAVLRPSPDSDIRIEVWMPLAGWNGKYLGAGNFGWAGSFMTSTMLSGLNAGYAVASTDTGHESATPQGQGGRFALGHPEKMIDYGYRADHLMTVDAKAITQAFYGRAPSRSYWVGCSLGGLEGLIEAKRYPTDYDGIVAGAPPNPIVKFNAEQLWAGWLVHQDPSLATPRAKFMLLHQAVMKACASPIGQKQGFVDEPDKCAFEPKQLLCKGADALDCLTPPQVRLMDQIYQGPVNPRTGQVIFPGPAKGSEEGFADSGDGRPFPIALDMFKDFAFQDPNWDWSKIDWSKDIDVASAKAGPLLHVDADLKPFFDRGGKLLMYIGWNDGHNPEELIAYYKALLRKAGPQGAASAKLFTIPGMGHCFGGAGCDTFDRLDAIDRWVETGRAPQRIVASKVENGAVVRTRPLCAYPEVARYRGFGRVDNASSFACS